MKQTAGIWYFENVDLFEILCPHRVESMAERHTFNSFKKGDYIYFEDDPSKFIYLIADGRVKVGSYVEEGKDIAKAILGRGEIFGELALAGEDRRGDYAMALDDQTTVCPMSIADMQELMAQNKPLSFKIIKLIGLRLKKMERRLESLIFKDARTRVVEFLKELAEEKGQPVGYEVMVKNHFTHKDIASLTGTSRQTVTTILNELRSQNVLTFDRRRILFRDLTKLQ